MCGGSARGLAELPIFCPLPFFDRIQPMLARIGSSVGCLIVLGGLLVVLPGCSGESTCRVTGKVKFQGKELDGGHVVFVNQDATKVVREKISSDGSYSASVPYGAIRYAVEPAPKPLQANIPGKLKDKASIPGGQDAAKMYAATEGTYVDIPMMYRNAESSKWTVTIDSGSKTL